MTGNKSILLCGNGKSGEVIKNIREWGYNVVLMSEFPNEIGVQDANHFLQCNTKDPEAALSSAKELRKKGILFDGVISLCWDCATSVATIAHEFNLHSVSIETAKSATHKHIRSNIFEREEVPSPKYKIANNFEELKNIVDQFAFPIILKPVDLSSSKGVVLVEEKDKLLEAFNYARSFSTMSEIVVNEYIVGSEHSTEGLMINGKFYPTALSDRLFKYDECKPYFVEIGDIMPTILSEPEKQALYDATEKAALAVGIINGVAKGDLIYCKNRGPFVFEIAARLGGPRFGTEMVPLSNGTNILKAAIQQSLGEKIDTNLLKELYHKGMVNRSIFPIPGKIVSIDGLETIKAIPGYYDFKWWGDRPLKPGDIIEPYENNCGNVGYFIATGGTREEAIKNADLIEKSIKIETIPVDY